MLADRDKDCRTMWIRRSGPKILQPQIIEPPSKNCYVCGKQRITLTTNVKKFTLRELFDSVLMKRLGMNEPCIDVINRE